MAGLVLAFVLLAAVQIQAVSRYEVNQVRITDLHDKLDGMKHKYEENEPRAVAKVKELLELEGRVTDLEGHDCGHRQWRCGTATLKCIADLLVCDNNEDCADGSDEKHCDNPARAGVALSGDTYNVQCLAESTPTHMQMNVIGEKRLSWFPTVAELQVYLKFDFEERGAKEGIYNGMYYYGSKTMVVYPKEGDGIAITCVFTTVNSDYCHATFRNLKTKAICGQAVLVSA